MSTLLLAANAQSGQGGSPVAMIVLWVVVIGVMMYFVSRPQKKEQKRREALIASLEAGDTVLTTSGFYGVVIGMDEDTVIVEFGNNKNCRIPMQKAAINQVEKPQDAVAQAAAEQEAARSQDDGTPKKRKLFGK